MKIDVSKLAYTKATLISEDLTFDPEVFKCHFPLIETKEAHVDLKIQRFEEFIYVTIKLKARVVMQCSYTLQNFEATLHGEDELHFAASTDVDEDCIEIKGNIIELDSYIFNLLSASVPMTPKAPGAKVPNSGKSYTIMSDEEYYKRKAEDGNSQFDALKDLDFDE